MTDDTRVYGPEHCSRWHGIPQGALTLTNRLHIEILCKGFRLGPWNIPVRWANVDFGDNRHTSFILRRPQIATYDTDALTRLVVLAHDRCVRLDVSPHTFQHLRVGMWTRSCREGRLFDRHPTIEGAIAAIRGNTSR